MYQCAADDYPRQRHLLDEMETAPRELDREKRHKWPCHCIPSTPPMERLCDPSGGNPFPFVCPYSIFSCCCAMACALTISANLFSFGVCSPVSKDSVSNCFHPDNRREHKMIKNDLQLGVYVSKAEMTRG